MNGYNRLKQLLKDDLKIGLGLVDSTAYHLNKHFSRYIWQKRGNSYDGSLCLVALNQKGEVKKHHYISINNGWETILADFLENEILLGKLELL